MPRGRPKRNVESPAADVPKQEPMENPKNNNVLELGAGGQVEAIKQVIGDKSTDETLFPDFFAKPEETEDIKEEPKEEPKVQEEEVKEVNEEVKEKVKEVTQEAEKSNTFDIEEFFKTNSSAKKRVKIDGVEEEVTLEELLRNYQTGKHLGKVGQKIGEERRRIREEIQRLEALKKPNDQVDTYDDNDPKVKNLESQIMSMTEYLRRLEPMVYENNQKILANQLKEEGFDDFLTYIPKIQTYIAGLEDEKLIAYYDTPEGAKSLYFRMKAQEAVSAPKQRKEEPKPIIKIDAGSSTPAPREDLRAEYKKAWEDWKTKRQMGKTASDEFSRVLRLKEKLSQV